MNRGSSIDRVQRLFQLRRKLVTISKELVENQPSEFKVIGYEMLEREVKQSGNTGRVYLPKSWIGKRIKIIRVSEIEK
jgi:hypothetical protein